MMNKKKGMKVNQELNHRISNLIIIHASGLIIARKMKTWRVATCPLVLSLRGNMNNNMPTQATIERNQLMLPSKVMAETGRYINKGRVIIPPGMKINR
jgi:hypothetical protein